ncbi:MAG: hypothetical protein Q7U91_04450 [Sideroxyarcus sp.]|nr:hypothetical protein [Sideroxyarcus sp.]
MQKTAMTIALVISAAASAADLSRCGSDQFGNTVCLDKDGVLSTRSGSDEGKGAAASGVPEADSNAKRDETKGKLRCGIDSFGNTVCQ